MMIVLLTKDLFFVPTVRSAAAKVGLEVVVALSVDSSRLDGVSADNVAAWIVDLSAVSVADLPSVTANLVQRFPQATTVAFGPHVQEQRLQAARAAGCQHVLTRGQLDSQIDRLLPLWIQS